MVRRDEVVFVALKLQMSPLMNHCRVVTFVLLVRLTRLTNRFVAPQRHESSIG